jgi:tetratricopeptide (TPR) repeat protein
VASNCDKPIAGSVRNFKLRHYPAAFAFEKAPSGLAPRLQPSDPNAHYNLARALDQAGRTTEAIEQYQQALALNPGFAAASNALAKMGAAK